jgi:hypothetical protein
MKNKPVTRIFLGKEANSMINIHVKKRDLPFVRTQ